VRKGVLQVMLLPANVHDHRWPTKVATSNDDAKSSLERIINGLIHVEVEVVRWCLWTRLQQNMCGTSVYGTKEDRTMIFFVTCYGNLSQGSASSADVNADCRQVPGSKMDKTVLERNRAKGCRVSLYLIYTYAGIPFTQKLKNIGHVCMH